MTMIQVRDIFHQFGGKLVLKGINFSMNQGEIVVVMGPNGMGKSTLLSAVGGNLKPLRGGISIGNLTRFTDPDDELKLRKQTMYLPDSPWAPPVRTAREWAYSVGKMFPIDGLELIRQIEGLVQIFDMDRIADAPISSYSAGQRKKAELILALAPQTPVLVLDEPFSGGLDPTGLYAVKEILRARARQLGHTILIATPTPELVEEVADRVIILSDGAIAAEGTLEELREKAQYQGSLAGVYERLGSTDIEARVRQYQDNYMVAK